jgi:shikimate kinase / 3-dehydroquinate synthase
MIPESPAHAIYLYGPPGSGKSTIGRALADALSTPFWDLDQEIENHAGMPIAEIFAIEGEAGFRARERRILHLLVGKVNGVVALGGGSLLDTENRKRVEQGGEVFCLSAPVDRLIERLHTQVGQRPLLFEEPGASNPNELLSTRLTELLEQRKNHYASFPRFEVSGMNPQEAAWELQVRLGRFHVRGMGSGYDVFVRSGCLDELGNQLRAVGLREPVALVFDDNVAELYASRASEALERAGYAVSNILIPAGEANKNLDMVSYLWEAFVQAGLERGSTVVSLGGGVVGDLAGFAAAAYLRGIAWVAVPTTLLAMADASLGGKTAIDLPQGKNLVGAFHPPRLVLADPGLLSSLPESELRSGLAEVVKAGVIGDPLLYDTCARGWESVQADWGEVVRRSMAVKIQVIQEDPYEGGQRAALNFGHTIGHALELVSGFELRHGEAVSIGMVAEARLAERMGIAASGLSDQLVQTLSGLHLPTAFPASLDQSAVFQAVWMDKKRAARKILFALPAGIGEIRVGCEVENLDSLILSLYEK